MARNITTDCCLEAITGEVKRSSKEAALPASLREEIWFRLKSGEA